MADTLKDEDCLMSPVPPPIDGESASSFHEYIGAAAVAVIGCLSAALVVIQKLVSRSSKSSMDEDERTTIGTRADRLHDPRPECLMEFNAIKQSVAILQSTQQETKDALLDLNRGRRENGEKMSGLAAAFAANTKTTTDWLTRVETKLDRLIDKL